MELTANVGNLDLGQAAPPVINALMAHDFDPGVLRPYIEKDGRSYMTLNKFNPKSNKIEPQVFVSNAPATLKKDEWLQLDTALLTSARTRLAAWADLSAAATKNVPNGLGTTVLQQQTQTDVGVATFSMDALRETEKHRPIYDVFNFPLPIVHSDFSFTARELAVSRKDGVGLDTTMAEMAGRRIAEAVEQLTIGSLSSYSFGAGVVYGYINHPQRVTYTFTDPTSATWTPEDTIDDLLAIRKLLQDKNFYGPYRIYTSPNWDLRLDKDFSGAKGSNTLRQRILQITDFSSIKRLEYLTNNAMIIVQLTQDVARAVVGMPLRTIQWESHGGMMLHWKAMAIMVPQLRLDALGNIGICHAS